MTEGRKESPRRAASAKSRSTAARPLAKTRAAQTKSRSRKKAYDFLSIIVPVYNEGENIVKTLSSVAEKIKTPHKIFIVYDFDEDNTLPAVKPFLKTYPITLVKNRYGKGVLNAIKTGFDSVAKGVVLVIMADLSDDLVVVDSMFAKMNEGYDIVCGSRYMEGGRQVGGPAFKKLLSRTAGVTLHYLTGIPTHDVTNSFKMYSKKVLSDISIESNGGFELGMEIVVKSYLKGYRIAEVPSVWTDRTAGESRFMLKKWLPKYLHWYLYAFKNNIRRRLDGPGQR